MLPLVLLQHGLLLSPDAAVLRVRDAKSRVECVLVGTMHYNPASIALAKATVSLEAESGRLRAVAVESCPTRWNATGSIDQLRSLTRTLCYNEMQAAAEAGEAWSVPLVLADQPIESTGRRATQILALTLAQLATPWAGGWSSIGEDLAVSLEHVKGDDGRMRPGALFNLPLLVNAPVSLFRYPLAIVLKQPLAMLPLALIAVLLSLPPEVPAQDVNVLTEVLGASAILALETVILGRLLLVGLLEERNYVLARNIREACLRAKPGGSVVAVLGMAHCNGVASLLKQSRIM
ncbi:hypothetical protein AB1Y20_018185 [Prymnesium parvum]|uniref:TraB domain-containing protein n=1 Tax=Prymnesium parvum TaxID=97485 RepID=A0AB34JNJ8_PRYPA